MKKWAYFNEIDQYKAQWLRNLIAKGVIPDGEVDERNIQEVQADDVRSFAQCHWFAGVGVWAFVLRRAGWPDDRPAWTASCPCPPFSAAGQKKRCPGCGSSDVIPHAWRTGYFACTACPHEWLADARHLWPEVWRLARDGRPAALFGEQVAGPDGAIWFASVRASLGLLGYAARGGDFSAASAGAPHIRQRLYFVADAGGIRRQNAGLFGGNGSQTLLRPKAADNAGGCNASFVLADAESQRRLRGPDDGDPGRGQRASRSLGTPDGLADDDGSGIARLARATAAAPGLGRWPCPSDGGWAAPDWLLCRDGSWRPVEPGTFPLVDGSAFRLGSGGAFEGKSRVAMLKGYGDAIVAGQAAMFVAAAMLDLGPN